MKTYHKQQFAQLGFAHPSEEFFSTSGRNVIRGMHLQLPPAATTKCVACLSGAILDVVLDLRRNALTYGKVFAHELSEKKREMLFIPEGCAHGFLSLTENSLISYQMSAMYAPNQDAGIRWDSFGFDWPVTQPILSIRDQALPTFAEFASPF